MIRATQTFVAGAVASALILAVSLLAIAPALSGEKMITCPFLKEGRVTFDVPAKLGAMPKEIDFDYPAKATRFSFRDGNLMLVAMDEGSPSRLRIMISAQLNQTRGSTTDRSSSTWVAIS